MADIPQRIEILKDVNQSTSTTNNLDNWIIINASENNDNEETELISNYSSDEAVEVAEIAENVIKEEQLLNGITDDRETRNLEDSDISVLDDGDYENAIVQTRSSKILDKNDFLQYLEKIIALSQNGLTKNIVIVCLLGIILTMYTNHYSNVENDCVFTNGMDVRLENRMLMDHLKELNTVLTQMRPFMSKLSTGQNRQQNINENESKFNNYTEQFQINNSDSFPEMLLQSSLNGLCLIVNKVKNAKQPTISKICESRGVIFNLIEFKNVINNSLQEFHKLNNPTINKYLQDMELKLSHLCQSLVDDLSVAVDKLILKVYNNLTKANHKLNKWVCAIKNNKHLYNSFLTSFDKNNVTLEGCDDTTNITEHKYRKTRNYVENNSSNVTFDFWRIKGLNNHHDQMYDKTDQEKRCAVKKNTDRDSEKFCQFFGNNKKNNISSAVNKGKSGVKSTFKIGKNKKIHKIKGKQNKKYKLQSMQRDSSTEIIDDRDDEKRTKYELKQAKYKKYVKKGKKCSNKKCKKVLKYIDQNKSVYPTSHFDDYYTKKKKSRNAPFQNKINTASQYSKTIILTTEKNSGSEEEDLFQLGMNADWQFERNQAREMYRRLQNEPSDWYFERANSRKHARKDVFSKKLMRNSKL